MTLTPVNGAESPVDRPVQAVGWPLMSTSKVCATVRREHVR